MPAPLLNLAHVLSQRAARAPSSVALTLLADGEVETCRWTWLDLHLRSVAFARQLEEHVRPGDPVVLFADDSLSFIAAFFGCLYVGAIPTPLHPPNPALLEQALPRLQAILNNARPRVIAVPSRLQGMLDRGLRGLSGHAAVPMLPLDPLEGGVPPLDPDFQLRPHRVALLQYTSGSTGMPKGVVVSHENLVAQHELLRAIFGFGPQTVTVTWLPLFHDMGLIGKVLLPIYVGCSVVVMPPAAFLRKPYRWLSAVSRYKGTLISAPNFAYELCVQRITDEQRATLDLSSLACAACGAEPVRADTIDRFCQTFEPNGFRRAAFFPVYGLAEATLLVTGQRPCGDPLPRVTTFDSAALERGVAIPVDDGLEGRRLVGCGGARAPIELAIVDPQTSRVRPEREIGEVWTRGCCVAEGYWQRPTESAQAFQAMIDGGDGVPYLRTGDLGFLHEGQLFVVGRLKDIIIVRGRNHYPSDLERTVEDAMPALRKGCSVAFGVDVDGEERVVLAVELSQGGKAGLGSALVSGADPLPTEFVEQIVARLKEVVSTAHGVLVHDVVLLQAGAVLRTSSGKVRRRETRAAWLAGTLQGRIDGRGGHMTTQEDVRG